MKKNRLITKLLIIQVVSIVAGVCMFSANAGAATNYNTILNKWLYTQYYQCLYSSNFMTQKIDATTTGRKTVIETTVKNDSSIKQYMPSHGLAGNNNVDKKCYDIAKEAMDGGESGSSSITWLQPSEAESLMKKMQYVSDHEPGPGNEGYFTIISLYTSDGTNYATIIPINDTVSWDSQTAKVVVTPCEDNPSGCTSYEVKEDFSNSFDFVQIDLYDHQFHLVPTINWPSSMFCDFAGETYHEQFDLTVDMHDLFSAIQNRMINRQWEEVCNTPIIPIGGAGSSGGMYSSHDYWRFGEKLDDSSPNGRKLGEVVDWSDILVYKYQTGKQKEAVKQVSGGKYPSTTSMHLSKTEFYNLYTYYINHIVDSNSSNAITCNPTATQNLTPIRFVYEGKLQDCYINLNGRDPANITVKTQATTGTNAPYITDITLAKIIDFLATLKDEDLDFSLVDDMHDTNVPETSEGENEPTCASRAGELGWILCPIIKGASSLLQGFFEDWIEPYLQLDAYLFSGSGSSSAVFEAWQKFQIIANLIFVAVFLFVIFSQLTGVGIDNYGIKKVLPKLIVGAILINLSFIICQLAVDLSNILGTGMKSLFASLSPDVSGIQINVNGGQKTGIFEAGAVVLTVIVGALAAQQVLSMGIMVIIPILIMVLTLLFSLFFLFFMLGIRQALAIILVVISPLAFVCYILPNTKALFKRWVDLFKAMLLAYPIASALVWGGDMVSKILIKVNADAAGGGVVKSLGLLVTAAIVSIAPVFAIPGLLKKSLSAISGVGNMLGKIQSGGRKGLNMTEKGMRNSRVGTHMQEWQDSRNKKREDNRNLRRAGFRRNEDGSIELSERGRAQNRRAERLGNSAGGRAYRQRLADARNAAFSSYNSDMSAARVATGAGAMATLAGLTNKQQQQEINDEILNMASETGNYDLNQMQSRFAALASRAPENLTPEDQLRMKALAAKMSETGFGAKAVANILSGRATGKNGKAIVVNASARKMLADYMTSTDIASKVGNKDMYVAQYMRDVAAGNIEASRSFDEWAQAESTSKAGYSNVEFVAKEILNDDELLAKQSTSSLIRTAQVDQGEYVGQTIQSDGTLREETHTITTHAGPAISAERADKIIKNENIHTKGEQEDVLSVVRQKKTVNKANIDAEAAARAARTPAP